VSIENGAQTICENVYDARGYRIRKDTYTSGTLSESRHYYYTPGWQCLEERTGSSTTAERQFVWGLRYIDDLVLRDRSTANNGTINERRYALQDGNWNTVAICDITGSVTERYAYSAYGVPVFMTGAGVAQASSPIGFETLYAGYRFDGTTPQMYYVRNRFLLPMIGTWDRRDPLGYVDGMSLYGAYFVTRSVDPYGLEWVDTGVENEDGRIYKVNGEFCAVKILNFKGIHIASKIVECPPATGIINRRTPGQKSRRFNCMRYALGPKEIPEKIEWWQAEERTGEPNNFPEEDALRRVGCRLIEERKDCKTGERKVALYKWKEDQFHILRYDGSGFWSGKCGLEDIYTCITDPDEHTKKVYAVVGPYSRKTIWCCPDPVTASIWDP